MQRGRDQVLADVRSVGLGGVDEVDPELHRAAQDRDCFLLVRGRAPDARAGEAHGPERQPAYGEIATQGERSARPQSVRPLRRRNTRRSRRWGVVTGLAARNARSKSRTSSCSGVGGGRAVLVERAGLRLGDVLARHAAHDHGLTASRAARDHDLVSRPHDPVRPRGLAVDVHLAAAARALGLGPRLEEAGDVEPDVDPLARARALRHAITILAQRVRRLLRRDGRGGSGRVAHSGAGCGSGFRPLKSASSIVRRPRLRKSLPSDVKTCSPAWSRPDHSFPRRSRGSIKKRSPATARDLLTASRPTSG